MVKTRYRVDVLEMLFRRELVVPLATVKERLGTTSRMTAFRKLKELEYRSSYSHAGRYYTLSDIPQYDEHGVWGFGGVWFSREGSLVNTLTQLVRASPAGHTAAELEEFLHVPVRNALRGLHEAGELRRRQLASEYVYLSCRLAAAQWSQRTALAQAVVVTAAQQADAVAEHVQRLLSVLNEKQRRLYLGLESLRRGRGGDTAVAALAGVNVKTVARGRRELEAGNLSMDRIRRPGAGRPPVKKTNSQKPSRR